MAASEPVEVDLTKHAPGTEYPSGRIGVNLPMDIPGYIRAYRIMGNVNGVRGLVGWVVEVQAFTAGVKVYHRWGMDGSYKVMTEDEAGREVCGEWERADAS